MASSRQDWTPLAVKTAKRPSIRDVAREAGVSHTTVSMILNGKKVGSTETRERVLEVSKRLDYQPDRLFRKAVTERRRQSGASDEGGVLHRTLGLVLNTPYYRGTQRRDGYYSGIMLGVCEAAEAAGWSLMISPQPQEPDGLPEMVLDEKVDGVIVGGPFPVEWLSALTQRKPVGFINAYYPSLDAICVTANWERVGFKLGEYAWQTGHRNIVHFRHDVPSENLTCVSRGIETALNFYGGATLHGELSRPRTILMEQDDECYEIFADEWLASAPRPTVIITSDYYAGRIGQALMRRGVRIPNELSLIGRGGNPHSIVGLPPLTSYADPVQEIGATATRMMIEMLQAGSFRSSHTMIDGEFLIRNSVRDLTLG